MERHCLIFKRTLYFLDNYDRISMERRICPQESDSWPHAVRLFLRRKTGEEESLLLWVDREDNENEAAQRHCEARVDVFWSQVWVFVASGRLDVNLDGFLATWGPGGTRDEPFPPRPSE